MNVGYGHNRKLIEDVSVRQDKDGFDVRNHAVRYSAIGALDDTYITSGLNSDFNFARVPPMTLVDEKLYKQGLVSKTVLSSDGLYSLWGQSLLDAWLLFIGYIKKMRPSSLPGMKYTSKKGLVFNSKRLARDSRLILTTILIIGLALFFILTGSLSGSSPNKKKGHAPASKAAAINHSAIRSAAGTNTSVSHVSSSASVVRSVISSSKSNPSESAGSPGNQVITSPQGQTSEASSPNWQASSPASSSSPQESSSPSSYSSPSSSSSPSSTSSPLSPSSYSSGSGSSNTASTSPVTSTSTSTQPSSPSSSLLNLNSSGVNVSTPPLLSGKSLNITVK